MLYLCIVNFGTFNKGAIVRKQKKKRINVYINEQYYKLVQKVAKENDLSVSNQINRIFKAFLYGA